MFTYNLSHIQGDTLTQKISVMYAEKLPINITGYNFIFTIKTKVGDVGCIFQKKWNNHSDPLKGVTALICTGNEMSLPAKTYFYGMQWNNPATGEGKTFATGKITVFSQITNSTA